METVTTTLLAQPTSFPSTGPSHPPLPIGAIVGGVCAGALLAVAVTVGWVYWGKMIERDVAKHKQAEALKKKRLSAATSPPANNNNSPNPPPPELPHAAPLMRTRTQSSSARKSVKFAPQDVTLGSSQGSSPATAATPPFAPIRPPPAMRSRSMSGSGDNIAAPNTANQFAQAQWTKFNSSTSSVRTIPPVPPIPTLSDAEKGVARPHFGASLPPPPYSSQIIGPSRSFVQGHNQDEPRAPQDAQPPPVENAAHRPLQKSSKSSNLSAGSSSVYSTASGEEHQTRVPSSLIIAALGGKKSAQVEDVQERESWSTANWRMSWTRSGFAWKEEPSRRLIGQGSYASIGSNNSSQPGGETIVPAGVAL